MNDTRRFYTLALIDMASVLGTFAVVLICMAMRPMQAWMGLLAIACLFAVTEWAWHLVMRSKYDDEDE